MKNLILVLAITLSTFTWALEIDEKLTVRILKVSETQKTILINRGIEDGLVVGDHAMYFLTTGVIARGVAVKVSPSRSIWSLYRLVTPEEIVQDKVVKIKISTAVKITEDPTKMLSETRKLSGKELISMAEGADDIPQEATDDEKQDLQTIIPGGKTVEVTEGVSNIPMMSSGSAYDKTLEIFANAGLNALRTTSSLGAAGTNEGKNSVYDLGLGLEKYFADSKSFLHPFSMQLFAHYFSTELAGIEGDDIGVNAFEYGAGVSWHFLQANPFVYNKYIGYINLSMGIGTSKDKIKTNQINSTSSSNSYEYVGSMNFLSLGVGMKYFLPNGLGARALLDYYRRGESYLIEGLSDGYTKVVEGPRLTASLSYRW